MAWRSWSATNKCPVCGGFPFAGKSGDQCRGGQVDFLPSVAYCSTKESSAPREKTWAWELDRAYEWQEEPARETDPTPIWERAATRAPQDLRHPDWLQTAVWDYEDEHGNYSYSVVRFDWRGEPHQLPSTMREKDYRPGRRAAEGSTKYRWGLPAELRVPYRLPELLDALRKGRMIWIVEGEKSADALVELGEAATTVPGGSASWFSANPGLWLGGSASHFAAIVDNDAAGIAWSNDVRTTLPGVTLWQSATKGEGDDVVNHLEAGHDLNELVPLELE